MRNLERNVERVCRQAKDSRQARDNRQTRDRLIRISHSRWPFTVVPKESTTVFKTPDFERLFILAEIHKFSPAEYKKYKKSLEKRNVESLMISYQSAPAWQLRLSKAFNTAVIALWSGNWNTEGEIVKLWIVMFALSAGTSTTRQRAIRRAELLPEPHLKIFPMIGFARPAESAKNTSRRRDKKTVTIRFPY